MKLFPFTVLVLCAAVGRLSAAEVEWHPDANMDAQLFPSLIIATATQRPDDEEANEEDNEPDPELLGDPYGAVGVSIIAPADGTKVRVTLLENGVMNKSSWSGVLESAGTDYYIAPKVNYKFEQLRKVQQQVPLNVTFTVEANGKKLGEQTETLTLRTINDCPFGVSEAEETIDNENKEEGEDGEEEADDGEALRRGSGRRGGGRRGGGRGYARGERKPWGVQRHGMDVRGLREREQPDRGPGAEGSARDQDCG